MIKKELMPIVYVAGNYSNGATADRFEKERNRDLLRYYSAIFIRNGWAVLSPIENDLWAYDLNIINYDECLEKDFAFISRCDAIFFCPGWQNSKGAKLEYDFVTHQAKHVYTFHNINDERIEVSKFRELKSFKIREENKQNLNKAFITNVTKSKPVLRVNPCARGSNGRYLPLKTTYKEKPRGESGRFLKVNK